MLLVLLAMSVQPVRTAGKKKKKKTSGKQTDKLLDRLLTVKYAADYVLKDKFKKERSCQWSGDPRGTGQLKGPKIANPNYRVTRFFEGSQKYRFQHLIGTTGDDGHERNCIVWVGDNSQLFEPEPNIRTSGPSTRSAVQSAWGLRIFKDGPQLGAFSQARQASPKMWKWEKPQNQENFVWQMNFVAAHVEIQEKKGQVWKTLGSWLIPTTKSSNSQTSKKCKNTGKKRKNPHKWQHLRNGAPVTGIKLKKNHSNCPPNDD